ncbi:MAG: hypothetical protein GXY86_12885 [Firmicutes bacterium]|nr:hypothetical protein [Bacillota bacterium]
MNQAGNQRNPQLFLVIGMVVLIIIITTSLIVGGQVYWWQKNIALQEKKELQRQINTLQNELVFLREDLGMTVLEKTKSQKERNSPNDAIYIDNLSGMERQVITALKNRDLNQLASLVHPEKGVRFSPFSYVNTSSDRVVPQKKIKYLLKDPQKHIWGHNDSDGLTINMSSKEYFDNYVFDSDYANADEVNYNATIGRSLTVSNIFEIYPRSIIVEFGKDHSGPNTRGEDWRSIKLVFEKNGVGKWFLVGIVHDRWTF